MDCVLIFFQRPVDRVVPDKEGRQCPNPSWAQSLKMMTGDFLNNVLDFNKDLINEESIELAEPYQRMEDYNFEAAKNVCGNVAGLLSWTVAMTKFFSINKEVI